MKMNTGKTEIRETLTTSLSVHNMCCLGRPGQKQKIGDPFWSITILVNTLNNLLKITSVQ